MGAEPFLVFDPICPKPFEDIQKTNSSLGRMIKMKYILNQTISGTREDSHGEKQTKEFLEKLCRVLGKRCPLYQQHDMQKNNIGYVENFRVVPDEDYPGEWLLKGDVYYTCNNVDDALKGFSYSFTVLHEDSPNHAEYSVYIPYPYYNDQNLILYLKDKSIAFGYWYKKAAEQINVALIVTGINLLIAPLWKQVYDETVAPHIKKILREMKPLQEEGLSFNY
ncbi:MAG: hypothetical protein ABSB79_15800, partial [Syntrophales bacterium]